MARVGRWSGWEGGQGGKVAREGRWPGREGGQGGKVVRVGRWPGGEGGEGGKVARGGRWCEVARTRERNGEEVPADLDDHSRREAAGEEQVGDAREVEVIGAPVGAGECEDREKHGRDDAGDHGAQQLPRAVLLVDEEHHRGEEELAEQVDHLWPETWG